MSRTLLIFFMVLIPYRLSHSHNLLEIFQLALINDPEQKITEFNRLATNEIKSQSIAQMLPLISANRQTNYNHLNAKKTFYLGTGVQNYWDHIFSVNVKQPLFNWSHWIQLDQAELKIAEVEAEQRAKYQTLITRTITAYFGVLSAQDKLEFSQAEKNSIEKQLERAKVRYRVGLASKPDLYEAQSGYDRSIAAVIEAQKQLDNAKEALHEIIGMTPQELSPLQQDMQLTQPDPIDIYAWVDNAEMYNSTIHAQLNKTEFARKNIDLQSSRHLPTIDLTAEFRIEDSNAQFGFRGDTFAFGLLLNIPLFEGGATLSRTRQAQYDYEAAREELVKTRRSVKRTVKEAYKGVLADISKVSALKVATHSAELALQSAEIGFDSGLRNMIDVLIEQRNFYKAKVDYKTSCYEYFINAIRLKEAAGELSEADIQQINAYLVSKPSTQSLEYANVQPETIMVE